MRTLCEHHLTLFSSLIRDTHVIFDWGTFVSTLSTEKITARNNDVDAIKVVIFHLILLLFYDYYLVCPNDTTVIEI